jgi:hypothetical protein
LTSIVSICTAQIWSIVEVGVGIIAGSLASLRALSRKLFGWGSSCTGSGKIGISGEAFRHTQELSYMKPSEKGKRSNTAGMGVGDNYSQEFILDQDKITKRVEVTIERSV